MIYSEPIIFIFP